MVRKKHTALHEWQQKAKEGGKCAWCGEIRDLTVDHIVPVHLLLEFEVDNYEARYEMDYNFQLLCKQCNKFKSGHLELKNPRTYSVLETLIKKVRQFYQKD